MTTSELTNYFIEWRKNRLDKLAPQVIVEFRENPSRHQALHQLAITSNPYPIQEYASWLVGHILIMCLISVCVQGLNVKCLVIPPIPGDDCV